MQLLVAGGRPATAGRPWRGGPAVADSPESCKSAAEINIGGAITITQRNHVVETLGGNAFDDLIAINGGLAGRTIVLRAANTDHTVIVKDAAMGGNLQLEGDFSLDNSQDSITLFYDGTNWIEKARSNNGS